LLFSVDYFFDESSGFEGFLAKVGEVSHLCLPKVSQALDPTFGRFNEPDHIDVG
jgi:hypothetical protein